MSLDRSIRRLHPTPKNHPCPPHEEEKDDDDDDDDADDGEDDPVQKQTREFGKKTFYELTPIYIHVCRSVGRPAHQSVCLSVCLSVVRMFSQVLVALL